jgi:hypothetical protein
MSKLILAFVLLSSAALWDPAQVVSHLGPPAQHVGEILRDTLNIKHVLPGFVRTDRH